MCSEPMNLTEAIWRHHAQDRGKKIDHTRNINRCFIDSAMASFSIRLLFAIGNQQLGYLLKREKKEKKNIAHSCQKV